MRSKLLLSMTGAVLCLVLSQAACANAEVVPAFKVNLHDEAALQRGAKVFMNYCSGCHSLKYMRYNRMAKDIDITDLDGKVDEAMLMDNLMFNKQAKISDPIISAMPEKDAIAWFGMQSPDLSLIIRSRSAAWVYAYLHSFYQDPNRVPWGSNNLVFANVAMPNVLERLQGVQVLDTAEGGAQHPPKLRLKTPGELTPAEFDQTVSDVVTFLSYVAEPQQLYRKHLGWWVLAFLLIFALSAYGLKREYWKDIK